MHRLLLIPILLLSFFASPSSLAAVGNTEDGSILLPIQKDLNPKFSQTKQLELSRSPAWQRFTQQHGRWGVLWNELTGSPHRAYGNAIPIPGYQHITNNTIEPAARAFLTSYKEVLGVRPEELRLVRANEVNGKWYVTYRQVYYGIDVLFSEVELRISSTGNVMAFGADFYSDITVSSSPSISFDLARLHATSGLESVIEISGEGNFFILPVVEQSTVHHHLVYEVFVRTENPVGNYITLVDAHDGTILWRHNKVRHTLVTGRVTGMVQLVLPTDPFVEQGFFDQHVNIGGVLVTTDSLGYYSRDISSSTTLTTNLSGPYVNVNRADAPDASFSTTVNPGDTVDILWDESNAHPAERDGFYHTNIIHDFVTTLDPNFTNINYSMPCAVNINSVCNAFWDGFGINFFAEGGGCPNTAQMPDVVYHEYGHGINDKLYQQLGQGAGMINGATHEGMADVAASVILDDSRVGRGFFGPGSVLRDLNNTNRYPENVSSDPHITGLIIGGAFWDLREATDLETYRYLTHFAKYGLPDDIDDGTAFSEWFIETIIADDDDGNLGNGTPHLTQIAASFNIHGIGSELYFRSGFSHTALPNTTDTTSGYTAVFTLEGVPVEGGDPDSVQLVFSIDNFQTTLSVDATLTGTNLYEAEIPAQSWGTLVKYYITTFDELASVWYTFPENAPADSSYRFMVGSQPAQQGVMYAATTGTPSGNLYAINPETTELTLIGALGVRETQSLAVRPSTGDLYGSYTSGSTSTLYRISPLYGDALFELSTPIANLRAIAFGQNDTLYGVTATGSLYRIDVTTGAATFIGSTAGNLYWGLAMDPFRFELWGSVRFSDRIYRINRTNGASTLVGETGFNSTTTSMTFDPQVRLFAITATNQFIQIDTTTGVGTLIGVPTATGFTALGMRTDSLILAVGEPEFKGLPEAYDLGQNFPNPFNPATEIRYSLPEQSQVHLTIFNVLGQNVKELHGGEQKAGYYVARWDGTNRSGEAVSSGIYLYKLEASGISGARFVSVKKMVVIR
jgi:Zn-dependent metalloprotease